MLRVGGQFNFGKEGVGMKKMRALKNRKGFTLIELLIVIAVIAILIALIAPAIINAVDRANTTTAAAIKKTYDNAIQRFYAENNRYPSSEAELIPNYLNQKDVEEAKKKFDILWVAGNNNNPPTVTVTKKVTSSQSE